MLQASLGQPFALDAFFGLSVLDALRLGFALACFLSLSSDLALGLSLDLALAFFWLGVLGVSLRSLGDSKVPRQLALPHQQGYSALSFLV